MTTLPWGVQDFLDPAAAAFRRLLEPASAFWAILAFVCIGTIFSAIIPPFQSPDEFDHLKAADMLGREDQ